MSADRERGEGSPEEGIDPRDEHTQPIETDDAISRADALARADTTTVGSSFGPPLVVDDEQLARADHTDDTNDTDDTEEFEEPQDETIVRGTPAATDRAAHEPSTRIAPSSSLHPMLLERIEPSLGRGERLRLDASHWRVSLGRAEESDIRLYTASASREHAIIAGNERGEWMLTPGPGKSVLIDGEATAAPLVLELGMNIILGQDHLRCVSEGLARGEMAAMTAADAFKEVGDLRFSGLRRWAARLYPVGWAILLLSLIAMAWLLLAGRES